MSECVEEEREVSITVTFRGCAAHGGFEAESAHMSVAGISAFAAVDSFFATIEETLAIQLSRMPMVEEFLNREYRSPADGSPAPISDDAQMWLARLFAHSLMLSRVADRGYGAGRDSAFLTVPRM